MPTSLNEVLRREIVACERTFNSLISALQDLIVNEISVKGEDAPEVNELLNIESAVRGLRDEIVDLMIPAGNNAILGMLIGLKCIESIARFSKPSSHPQNITKTLEKLSKTIKMCSEIINISTAHLPSVDETVSSIFKKATAHPEFIDMIINGVLDSLPLILETNRELSVFCLKTVFKTILYRQGMVDIKEFSAKLSTNVPYKLLNEAIKNLAEENPRSVIFDEENSRLFKSDKILKKLEDHIEKKKLLDIEEFSKSVQLSPKTLMPIIEYFLKREIDELIEGLLKG